MESIILNEKEAIDYIRTVFDESKLGRIVLSEKNYHHNAPYGAASSIVEHGILSVKDLNDKKIVVRSLEQIERLSESDSHINGINGVSLSKVGLKDLYLDEDEYDPTTPEFIDFIVNSNLVQAARRPLRYGNEFISPRSIKNSEIIAADVRILNYIKQMLLHPNMYNATDLLNKFNGLCNGVRKIKELGMVLPIREMSDNDDREIDNDKLISQPKLVLKK